jgi:hypothetical protein
LEIPVEIAACGPDYSGESIVDGPQAAMIVGDLKVIVQCWWRSSKDNSTAQLYNITNDPGEWDDLSESRPDELDRLLGRLDFWERQSVPPYPADADGCGQGKPHDAAGGLTPYWDTWC